jgi:hypothetical protein
MNRHCASPSSVSGTDRSEPPSAASRAREVASCRSPSFLVFGLLCGARIGKPNAHAPVEFWALTAPLQPAASPDKDSTAHGRMRLTADADQFAANVLPILQELRASGARGYGSIASVLNQRGIRTARGGQWHVSTVRNLLLRAAPLQS